MAIQTTQADQLTRFLKSYLRQQDYPQNLVYKGTYRISLTQTKERLASVEEKLFTKQEDEVNVPFRDFDRTGAVVKNKVWSDDDLKTYLSDTSCPDPLDSTRTIGNVITKPDPQCRFVFCSGGHARRRLFLTSTMFRRLMTFHQVMPTYVDLVTMFGNYEEVRDLRFGRFSAQSTMALSSHTLALDAAGRSGQSYQMCFPLKAPSYSGVTTTMPQWYIEQAAIYHQFDVVNGRACWIITKGDWQLKDWIQDLTNQEAIRTDGSFQSPASCFQTSLGVHLMLCHWSTEGWRDYLEMFEDVVDSKTNMAIHGRTDTRSAHIYQIEEVKLLQALQDRINEAVMVMKLNSRIINSLRKHYENLLMDQSFPLMNGDVKVQIEMFSIQLNDMIADLESHTSRAELFTQIAADRKDLIIYHLQAQATSTMENLTKSMHQIGIISQNEAVAMRIITVVALLYLPPTFVSTFFSTDIVKYQPNNSDSTVDTTTNDSTSFSSIALQRWLEVTLPLTVVTLAAAFYFFKRTMKSRLRSLGIS